MSYKIFYMIVPHLLFFQGMRFLFVRFSGEFICAYVHAENSLSLNMLVIYVVDSGALIGILHLKNVFILRFAQNRFPCYVQSKACQSYKSVLIYFRKQKISKALAYLAQIAHLTNFYVLLRNPAFITQLTIYYKQEWNVVFYPCSSDVRFRTGFS